MDDSIKTRMSIALSPGHQRSKSNVANGLFEIVDIGHFRFSTPVSLHLESSSSRCSLKDTAPQFHFTMNLKSRDKLPSQNNRILPALP